MSLDSCVEISVILGTALQIERLIHAALSDYRLFSDREAFSISLNEAKEFVANEIEKFYLQYEAFSAMRDQLSDLQNQIESQMKYREYAVAQISDLKKSIDECANRIISLEKEKEALNLNMISLRADANNMKVIISEKEKTIIAFRQSNQGDLYNECMHLREKVLHQGRRIADQYAEIGRLKGYLGQGLFGRIRHFFSRSD